MSYIRSNSNPEALYIYNTGDNIEICWNVSKPETGIVGNEDFVKVLETFRKRDFYFDGEGIHTKTLSIELTNNFKIKLFFADGKSVEIWDVTWDAVVREYERRRLYSWTERFKFLFDRLRYFNY